MLTFIPFPLLIGILVLVGLLPVVWRRKRNVGYLIAFCVFWAYLLLVTSLTLFPIPIPEPFWDASMRRSAGEILARVNLIPFNYASYLEVPINNLIFEIRDNILLSIPFGFGMGFLLRPNARRFAWLAFSIGLAIELAQLAVSLLIGGVYRGVDISDVLLNALGAWIGYGAFWLVMQVSCLVVGRHSNAGV